MGIKYYVTIKNSWWSLKPFFALEIIQCKYDEYVCRIQLFMYQASFKETCKDGLFVQESVFYKMGTN